MVLRDGLRLLIDGQEDMHVVGEASSAREVAAKARELAADVAIIDLSMPGGGGVVALDDLSSAGLSTRSLVLTMHEDSASLRAALRAGAHGYIAKRAAGDRLIDAIRAVNEGRTAVEVPALDETELQEEAGGEGTTGPDLPHTSLSRREREVLRFVAAGYTNQEAADALGLSVKTVEGYRSRLMRKLGARGRVDLVRYALRHGLLDD